MKKVLIGIVILTALYFVISNMKKSTAKVSEEIVSDSEGANSATHEEIVSSNYSEPEKAVLIKLNSGIKQNQLPANEQIIAVQIATKGRG